MPSFILSLTYTAPIEAVDALLNDHLAWIEENRKAGHLVAGGRKVPRTGGVLLAVGEHRADIEAIAQTDPFITGKVATVEVIEWHPTFTDETVVGLRE